ncbi:DUF6461 domain-containing protein [Streptomyces sp. NPDC050619]|uniref:DUF6461 domain-containing protein n=1 Tax=Streptomyces sp. NPDC050619 TaxID=3157214 RepID=UPI0034131F82
MAYGEFAWLDSGDIVAFCVTLAKGLSAQEALERAGCDVTTLAWLSAAEAMDRQPPRSGPDSGPVRAARVGEWAVLLEFETRAGADWAVLQRLSRGAEAVSVADSDQVGLFCYAVDGVLVASFDTTVPEQRYGVDPDRLLGQMRAVGLLSTAQGAPVAISSRQGAMRLIQEITGVVIDEETMFDEELLTAWLVA